MGGNDGDAAHLLSVKNQTFQNGQEKSSYYSLLTFHLPNPQVECSYKETGWATLSQISASLSRSFPPFEKNF